MRSSGAGTARTDAFVYEIVVVPSIEDAIMAARLNFRLQACVIRRRFARRSPYDSSSLAQFVDSVVADDVMERTPEDRAQMLGRSLARLRPELDLYLMTEISVEDLAGRLSHHFRRIFHARGRVYSTQSTHTTLTSLRQGAEHRLVHDDDRHHPQLGGLPDRGSRDHRPRPGSPAG